MLTTPVRENHRAARCNTEPSHTVLSRLSGRRAGTCPISYESMLAYMKRTTVKIPDALDARLRHEADKRHTTISQINREALEAYLGVSPGRRTLAAAAAGHSGRTDISERIEEILAAEVAR